MKYNKTKYPNIYYYETAKGKRYYVRRSFFFRGKKREKSKSGFTTLPQARAALVELEQQIQDLELGINTNLTLDKYWDIYSEKRLSTGRWNDTSYYLNDNLYKNHIFSTVSFLSLFWSCWYSNRSIPCSPFDSLEFV